MPKLLLIYPSQLYAPYWGGQTEVKPHLVSLFSFLRHNKVDVEVLDLENEIGKRVNQKDAATFKQKALEILSGLKFDIVGISCWTSLHYPASLIVADICKKINPRCKIVVGGYHPSALPEDFVYVKSPFDFIVKGEGEEALLRICRNYRNHGKKPEIVQGRPLDLRKYFPTAWNNYKYSNSISAIAIYLSRGCEYNCSFCMESCKRANKWRSYSVKRSIQEVKKAVRLLKVKQILIADACFGFNKIWRKKFLKELIREKIDTYFWAQTRIELFDKEDIDLLSQLNFRLEFGLDSASCKILSIMQKALNPNIYLVKCRENIEYLNKKEVPYNIYLIFNHPGETNKTSAQTVSFLRTIIRKQKKISGMLLAQDYAFFPGSRIHRDYEYYRKQYGTQVKHEQWWKQKKDHYRLARSIIPSKFLLKPVRWRRKINRLNKECYKKMPLWPRFFGRKNMESLGCSRGKA